MLETISEWWGAFSQIEQIFWGIAILSTIIFIIQVALSFIGLDSDLESEFDDIDGGFSIISFRSLIAFLMFFGWGGIVSLNEGIGLSKTIMIAFLTGFLAMMAVAYLFSLMLRMQESGTVDLSTIIQDVADVYLTIPAKGSGKGRIQISVQGKVMELDAITDAEVIKTGAKARVLRILKDNVILVKSIK
jgi:hypothetical protein